MRCKAARHPFSLIEVMVVIVLMGVVATTSIFGLWPFYQSYRFRLEVESFYGLLQELQIEALTLQSDMKVRFVEKNGKWSAQSSSDEPILKSQTIDLSHVERLSGHPDIDIYSSGLIRPAMVLKMSYKDEHRWIDFSGGHLIKLLEKEPK